MTRRRVELEVDLDEFDDADILEAVEKIIEANGRAVMLGGGPETPAVMLHRMVSDLAFAIAVGNRDEALYRLDQLVGDNPRLRDAVDLGTRRVCRGGRS
jgi:hypothetical protein